MIKEKVAELEARVDNLERGVISLADLYKSGRLRVIHSLHSIQGHEYILSYSNPNCYGVYPMFYSDDIYTLITDNILDVDFNVEINLDRKPKWEDK